MLATMASFYVAGRLWLEAENRAYLINELDRRTGQGRPAITVDDTLKLLGCRDQYRRLEALDKELAAAKRGGFFRRHSSGKSRSGANTRKRLLAVIGIVTEIGHRNKRDAIRKSWLPTGAALEKLEADKGIAVRFVVGKSSSGDGSLNTAIREENRKTNDIVILDNHVESLEEQPEKTKRFFSYAADAWDAEFYIKANDDVYIDIGALAIILSNHLMEPRVYIGCMRSGEVFSEPSHKWYEPEWWKFGDKKSYFRHASGEIYIISKALAQFISINRSILGTYAHDDVSVGSWLIGLNARYINEAKLCCSSWSTGAVCSYM